ncbi:ATP-binding protein [Parahaliea mediterranea]|uniref:ATP-binding protein n=1 Tax=Parahaliea mediterranea TaxID=651086 RepID=A0A939DEK8_9GAMM|nr:ATP-binding protein [Parahaliea mediterranea]MBN7796062.1 ATP-binding protein [Parahaliea mediterranea]
MTYIPRNAESRLQHFASGYPVVVVTGPRQSGKSTLVKHAFPDHHYVSLEDLDQREFAETDPRGFLNQFSGGAILDEAQRCPALFSYLQTCVDERQQPGEFILTGSQQFGLLSGITQSLAGRAALLTLLPMTYGELERSGKIGRNLDKILFDGAYPPIFDRGLEPHPWQGNYVRTYLERDVRQLIKVQDLGTFQRFLKLCAGRTGQLLNLSSLANDAGITHNTAKAWISVLEASYIVHLLPPHHQNFSKRLVKTPKLYFLDTGLATWLLGIQNSEQLTAHVHRGALFETWVISELLKARYNSGEISNLYFWRDRSGHEVDLLIDHGTHLSPLEIKSGQTINKDYFKGLEFWQKLAGETAGKAWLVYGGDTRQIRSNVTVLPWLEINAEQIVDENTGLRSQ